MRRLGRVISGVGNYWLHRPRPVLFAHLPRCAGTTVSRYLAAHYPPWLTFRTHGTWAAESVERFKALPERRRYPYQLILGHLTNDLLAWAHPDTVTFTVFRDPVERIVSHYFYARQNPRHYLNQRIHEEGIRLEDYTSLDLSPELRNGLTAHFSGLSAEQAEAHPEEALQIALDAILDRYQVIGFQDALPDAVERLRRLAKLHKPFTNPVINRSNGDAQTTRTVTEEARGNIASVNSIDVELYRQLKLRSARQQPD